MADGAFGASTKAAVAQFQTEAKGWGIFQREPDGLADPDTIRLLNVDLSAYGWQAPEYYDFTRPDTLNGIYLFSKSCILMDGPSGEVLFESASRERRYPASTTKILTLMVALESGGLRTSSPSRRRRRTFRQTVRWCPLRPENRCASSICFTD